jgi:hypothetical protein
MLRAVLIHAVVLKKRYQPLPRPHVDAVACAQTAFTKIHRDALRLRQSLAKRPQSRELIRMDLIRRFDFERDGFTSALEDEVDLGIGSKSPASFAFRACTCPRPPVFGADDCYRSQDRSASVLGLAPGSGLAQ